MTSGPERIIRALACLAPGWRRDEWRREWLSEIAYTRDRHRRLGAFPPTARLRLAFRSCAAVFHVLDLWRHEWSLDMLWNDVSFALRRLAKRPVAAATIIATLAITIGLTTAIFSMVDAVLFRPLPYPRADRLVAVWPGTTVSPASFRELTIQASPQVEAFAAFSGWGFNVSAGDATEKIDGARVTPAFFDVFRVPPIAGRTFRDGDDTTPLTPLVVSERYQRRYPDRVHIGGRLTLDGRPAEIVGIMPAGFRFPGQAPEIWMPIPMAPSDPAFNANFATLLARLRDGDSSSRLAERLRPLAEARAAARRSPEAVRAASMVRPLQDVLVGDVRPLLRLLFAAVLIVLFVGCVNVANLLLAEGVARIREIAVRRALGASRGRLLRQLIVESATLTIVSGLVGVAAAFYFTRVIRGLLPLDTPRLHEVGMDVRVLAFALVVAAAAAFAFGLLSTFAASRRTDGLAIAGRGTAGADRGTARTRMVLVAGELALAMVLVSSAALVGRSYRTVVRTDPGFDYASVLAVPASLPAMRYHERDRLWAGLADVESRLRAVPGVVGVGAIQLLPLTAGNWNPDVTVDGRPPLPDAIATINWRAVTPGYFETMRIPLRRGRGFTSSDGASAMPVAVVNARFASTIFAGEDPIGERVRTGFEPRDTWVTIVGVVGDVRQHEMAEAPRPELYRPMAQHPVSSPVWMLRTTVPPATRIPQVRQALRSADPDIAIGNVRPLSTVVHHATSTHRAAAALLFSLAAGTLMLALIGVFGLSACEVAQRRGEIGVRLALGASPFAVLEMVLRRAATIGAVGVATGLIVSLAVGGLLSTLLVGVGARDPATLVVSAGLLLVASILASYVPARRAARLSPVEVLRLQ
jgi:putative ABC transport system permease protein